MPINPAYQFMNSAADLSDKNQFMDFLRRDAQAKGFDSNYGAGLANEQQMMNTMAAQQPQPVARPQPQRPVPNGSQAFTRPMPQPNRSIPQVPDFSIPEAPQGNAYQGFEGLGNFDELPIPQEPSGLVERSQMTEQDLPPEAPQGMRIAPPEQGTTIAPPTPFGDMRDDRLDQTTLAQRGRDMGFDPRQLMVALAQFSAGMGNIKGKDTASTAKDFYKMQLGIEQKQRDNDFKMEEMSKRYAPKPQREDPLMGIKQEMLRAQVEGQKNKVAIDSELNDPNSERSAVARKLFRTYLYQSSSTKIPQSEVDKLVPENATAATIYKMMPLGTSGVSQFNAADAMTQRLQAEAAAKAKEIEFRGSEAEKNRQAQIALEQQRQAGRMQTQAAKPLPQAKGTRGTVPVTGGAPEIQVPGWRKTQNVPIRDTELSAARNATAQVEPMNQNIAELQKMIRQNGSYENSFSEAGRRMAALSRDIQLQLKSEAFLQLGVLAGPDLLLLESLIPDTTSIKNMGQANAFIKQLEDVKNRLNAKVASKMKSLGFEPDVPIAQPSAPSSTGSTGLPVYRPGGQ